MAMSGGHLIICTNKKNPKKLLPHEFLSEQITSYI